METVSAASTKSRVLSAMGISNNMESRGEIKSDLMSGLCHFPSMIFGTLNKSEFFFLAEKWQNVIFQLDKLIHVVMPQNISICAEFGD